MLSKRKIKREVFNKIAKEKRSHQETYEELKKVKSAFNKEDLAEYVGKTPSPERNRKTMALRITFVVFLSLIILLRLLDILLVYVQSHSAFFLSAVLFGIAIPAMAIFGALTSRVGWYRVIAVLMILAVIRSVAGGEFNVAPILYLILIPFIGVAILGFVIPNQLKTPFKKRVVRKERNGREFNTYEFYFEEETPEKAEDLLDS